MNRLKNNACILYYIFLDLLIMNVHQANEDFHFDKLQLEHPVSMPGNSYFTNITMSGQPIYIETPQITTKQGFVKNAKKIICDLLFTSNESDFIQWIETLETTCHKLVHKNSGDWFQDRLEYDDIENAFSPCMKSYKSGKYQSCRCLVGMDHRNGNPIAKVYDETETPVPYTELTDHSQIIGIIEIKGIRFTTRSFQIEIDLRQVMMLKIDTAFDKCLIKKGTVINEKVDKIEIPLPKYQKINNKNLEDTEQDITKIDEPLDQDQDQDQDNTPENVVIEINTQENTNDEKEQIQNDETNTVQELSEKPNDITPCLIEKNDSDITLAENEIINETQAMDTELVATPDAAQINTTPIYENDLEVVDWDTTFPTNENDETDIFSIKRPNQVYHEIYKKAKEKARKLKREALAAILEANSLKNTYMLDDIDDDNSSISDFEDDEESIESLEEIQENEV